MNALCSILFGSVLLAACVATSPRSQAAPPDGSKLVTLTLVSETDALRPGTTVNLGLHFAIAPKWHIYWPGANDSGFPPSIDLTAPEGFTVGTPLWPAPVRHLAPGDLLDHVYEKEALVVVPLTIPADAKPGTTVRLGAASNWLVCEEACVPGEGKSALDLPIAAESKPSAKAALFTASAARLPGPLPSDGSVKCTVQGGRFVAQATGAAGLRFFPLADCTAVGDLIKQGDVKGSRLSLVLTDPKPRERVRGVLEAVFPPSAALTSPTSRFYSIDLPAVPAPAPESVPSPKNEPNSKESDPR